MLTLHSRDLPFKKPSELSDIFTSFRKTVEPLRGAPRKQLPKPDKLPPLPDFVPTQATPFSVPNSLDETISALWRPLREDMGFSDMPTMPAGVQSAHPFIGAYTVPRHQSAVPPSHNLSSDRDSFVHLRHLLTFSRRLRGRSRESATPYRVRSNDFLQRHAERSAWLRFQY